jgi:hypothetical protein
MELTLDRWQRMRPFEREAVPKRNGRGIVGADRARSGRYDLERVI